MAQSLVRQGVRSSRVLQAIAKVPRHLFVSEALGYSAYQDTALPIGFGQTITRPSTIGRVVQELNLKGTERVLEVGTGSGYQAAVIAELAREVVSIERIEELHKRAKEILRLTLRYTNITLYHTGDFSNIKGLFDAIVVAACAKIVPEDLFVLLRNGGTMLLPVEKGTAQVVKKYIKAEEGIFEEELGEVSFVPLIR